MKLYATSALALALGAGAVQAQQTEVNILRVQPGDDEQLFYSEVEEAYEAEHPDVDVVFEYIANEAYKSKLPTLLQSDARPDVFYSWGASLFIGGLGVPPYLATRAATRTIEPAHVALRIIASKGLSVGYGADITEHLSATVTYDPANLVDGATTTTTMTVTGAVVGDTVTVGLSSITSAGWQISGFVTAADTVTVAITNHTGRAVDLPSGTLRVDVWRH